MKINLCVNFHDESGQYEVHIVPFILKTFLCIFILFMLIGIAIELPSSVRYELKYSGKEYHLSNCERDYIDRNYEELYSTLFIYNLYDDAYGKYWEIVKGYEDYVMYTNYKNLLDMGIEQENLEISENEKDYREAVQVEFDAAQLCEKYRKKVLQDARDCKYQENERYFNEITAKLGDID